MSVIEKAGKCFELKNKQPQMEEHGRGSAWGDGGGAWAWEVRGFPFLIFSFFNSRLKKERKRKKSVEKKYSAFCLYLLSVTWKILECSTVHCNCVLPMFSTVGLYRDE